MRSRALRRAHPGPRPPFPRWPLFRIFPPFRGRPGGIGAIFWPIGAILAIVASIIIISLVATTISHRRGRRFSYLPEYQADTAQISFPLAGRVYAENGENENDPTAKQRENEQLENHSSGENNKSQERQSDDMEYKPLIPIVIALAVYLALQLWQMKSHNPKKKTLFQLFWNSILLAVGIASALTGFLSMLQRQKHMFDISRKKLLVVHAQISFAFLAIMIFHFIERWKIYAQQIKIGFAKKKSK